MDLGLIGAILKEEREGKGTSVADAAEALFMKKSTLDAIESGCWEMLPHPLYVKGYVKSYASYLGISTAIEAQLQPATNCDDGKEAPSKMGFTARAGLFLSTTTSRIAKGLWGGLLDACHLVFSGMRRAVLLRF